MKKKLPMETRPNYFHGQLLNEKDFLAEQNYHISSRHRHNHELHGAGIVSGFDVTRKSENSILITPGYAIDKNGQEIFVKTDQEINVKDFGANNEICIGLIHQDSTSKEDGEDSEHSKIIKSFAVFSVNGEIGDGTVLLAKIKLDENGHIVDDSINYDNRQYAGVIIRPGSIGVRELSPNLTKGWLTFQFRPFELENIPKGENKIPPCFRVGPTETITPTPEKDSNDQGAAGTMGIPIPPATKKITSFRIAGTRNEGEIVYRLNRGGWDIKKYDHDVKILLEGKVTDKSFFVTGEIDDSDFNPEFQTISIWVRCTAKAAISLVAIEIAY